ncbi:MAG: CdaR family protein [Eubacteriales bacterium]|nr:CdaR family protein [Eubacteriales bacterium]
MKKMIKNNWFMKLFAFLLAAIAWVIIINISDPTDTVVIKNIKVTTINDKFLNSKEKSYALEDNGVVSVQVQGRRTILRGLTNEDFTAEADLSKLSLTSAVEVHIKPKNAKLDILIINDKKMLNVKVENIISTPFPIIVKTKGKPKEGMAVGGTESTPSEVNIRGPESLIHNIKEVVASLNVEDAMTDITADVSLTAYDGKGEAIVSDNLEMDRTLVNAKAHIFKIRRLGISVIDLPKPEEGYAIGDVQINPSTVDVVGPKEILDKHPLVKIAYDESIFGKLGTETVQASLNIGEYLPENVYPAGELEKLTVQIVVARKESKSLTFDTSKIDMKNKSTKYGYAFKESRHTVTVSGAANRLNHILSVADIAPYIDVSEVDETTDKVMLHFKYIPGIDYGTENEIGITVKKIE